MQRQNPLHGILASVCIFSPGQGVQGQSPEKLTQPLASTHSPKLRDLKAEPEISRGRGSVTKSLFTPQPPKRPTPCKGGSHPNKSALFFSRCFA